MYYDYSVEELTILFESLIISLLTYAIVLTMVNTFPIIDYAVKYGYTNKYTPICEIIRPIDVQLWKIKSLVAHVV